MTDKPLSEQMQSAYEAFTLARIDAWTDKVAVLESRIVELEAEVAKLEAVAQAAHEVIGWLPKDKPREQHLAATLRALL